jgi:pyridoxamine 5'-phosphate oxidase
MTGKDVVSKLRREYISPGLSEKKISKDPLDQFTKWFDESLKLKLPEPNAMAVATSTKDGKPSIRMVLLKGFDEKGFVFYTNYESRKGKEIDENPYGSILIYWTELNRQIRIEGKIEKVTQSESEEYFNIRPYKSRVGAWASHQSSVISSRSEIIKKFLYYLTKYKTKVPLPPYWGGYRLIPNEYEFWQGRENRLHDRIRYRKDKTGKWFTERLAP